MDNPKRITLSDGTTWEPRMWSNSLMPVITNVDDIEREMTSAQWNEYASTFVARNQEAIRAARAKHSKLQRAANMAALDRSIADRKLCKV